MMGTVQHGLVLAQTSPPGGAIGQFMPLILILVVFYFLLVRPQQKKAKEHQQLVDKLKRNDHVVTTGGLFGRIQDVSEKTVTLEIAPNVRVTHDRSQIGSLQGKEG